jgi:hypothetical protein
VRLAHLTEWFKEAVRLPGSTFSIWSVGSPDRLGYCRFFGACIPEKWAGSVHNAKKDFLERARAGAAGSKSGLTEPEGCRPPGLTSPGRTRLVVAPDVSPLQTEVWQQIASLSATAPQLHTSIVCDRSGSTLGAACTPGALLGAFDRFLADSRLLPDSSLSVEMVGPLQDALQPFYHVRIPDLPVGERVAFVLSGRREIVRLYAGQSEGFGSTIAEAISVAARRLRERAGVYQIYIFSDMLQISLGGFNFEKQLPQPKDFVAWLKWSGLAADLRDIPVLACGIHTGHFGHNSQPYATGLQALWQQAFASMGATEIKLVSSCEALFAASHTGRS